MDDAQLYKISREMDNLLLATCNKYDMAPLSFSAVVLARLMVLNKEVGRMEDFQKLLLSAAGTETPDSITLQ